MTINAEQVQANLEYYDSMADQYEPLVQQEPDARDAILKLACTVCAMWAMYGNTADFSVAINTVTNAIFVYNQQLAPAEDIIDFCEKAVNAHEHSIGIVDLADGSPR